jgi:non-lysosomal glucosylceramidase
VGRVSYADPQVPIRIELTSYSPFIPLNAADSALPATVMSFTISNPSREAVDVDLIGWLQNAVCPYDARPELGVRRNTLIRKPGVATLEGTIEPAENDRQIETHHGYGSMALSLLDDGTPGLLGIPEVNLPLLPDTLPTGFEPTAQATHPLDRKLVGALGRSFQVPAGESRKIDFLITWYFPLHQQKGGKMAGIKDFDKVSRHYRSRFSDAADVAQKVAADFKRLSRDTLMWNRTWYGSTLPDWLLTRTFAPVDCLASQTFHWFDNGRVWGWEGVDCCEGTCTHVWNYAQAMARLFPEFERILREQVDYGLAFRDGVIGHRGELLMDPATDGQAGTIIRTWREHTMSANDAFLKRVWPSAKKALQHLIDQDEKRDGVLEGAQSHTLDATWHGPIAWISSVYCAALRAGQQMAQEMGDVEFAKTCADIAERGKKEIVARLFNGEYFIHLPPDHNHINTNQGSHIDQVLGQSWACQLQLPRVLPKKETTSALNALWKYNFTPDAGGYAIEHTDIKGHRVYAERGEAGMVMTTWPQGGADLAVPGMANRNEDFKSWIGPGGYFDECMTGFEYQVAAHMICEGEPDSELVQRGLAIARAVHDRYAPAKRNPFNEIECSDHYSRAMAAYGVFLAVCGFEYHGPKGHIAFAPKVNPDDFKAPFTAAEGWGSFHQQRNADGSKLQADIMVNHGKLRIHTVALGTDGHRPAAITVTVDSQSVPSSFKTINDKVLVTLDREVTLVASGTIRIVVEWSQR